MRNPSGHPFLAAILDFAMSGLGQLREEVVPLASGTVLEIGAGTGLNLPLYRPEVHSLHAVEPDPYMRRRLGPRASAAVVPVEVHASGAESMPFDDARFDAVVCTFTLCTVADPEAALAEVHRVLRPGGRLLFAEHVAADGGVARRVQHALDPAWTRIAGGCHLTRPAPALIQQAGFTLESSERRRGWSGLVPLAWGVARR
ncbi:MAG: ubiquinone/menaquinone biosynthesis C-methylase UbiE [Myxococcota bacterium]|jgi:ubiquinone/menaquinone biosynthesis C-methylase UbiE